jgi:phosphoribosylformylglycinamidine synthase subunit PurQ / glutaminase
VKACVIVFPGSNCDRDIKIALENVIGHAPLMVWHRETDLPEVDLIVVPGGFSYGDYLRSGAMAAHSPIMGEVCRRAKAGVHVLGVCNGFQILTEAGLLPGVLMPNAGLKFICKDVYLRTETNNSVFTKNYTSGQILRIPVANHDGNYFSDDETLKSLRDNDQIAFRYCCEKGEVDEAANPNGSCDNIAGILNQKRNVLGMMPHPERLAEPALGGVDGKPMFEGLLEALSK